MPDPSWFRHRVLRLFLGNDVLTQIWPMLNNKMWKREWIFWIFALFCDLRAENGGLFFFRQYSICQSCTDATLVAVVKFQQIVVALPPLIEYLLTWTRYSTLECKSTIIFEPHKKKLYFFHFINHFRCSLFFSSATEWISKSKTYFCLS